MDHTHRKGLLLFQREKLMNVVIFVKPGPVKPAPQSPYDIMCERRHLNKLIRENSREKTILTIMCGYSMTPPPSPPSPPQKKHPILLQSPAFPVCEAVQFLCLLPFRTSLKSINFAHLIPDSKVPIPSHVYSVSPQQSTFKIIP